MTTYRYTTVPGKIRELMESIRKISIPKIADKKWLSEIGFNKTNHRTMLPVLKFIGFTSEGGIPSELWRLYRGVDHAKVLAGAIQAAYKPLFDVFGNPHDLAANQLKDYFSENEEVARGTISKIVDTFKALCSLADFRQPSAETGTASAVSINNPHGLMGKSGNLPGNQGKIITVNIEIELPVTDDPKVYERIFKALKEYLLD